MTNISWHVSEEGNIVLNFCSNHKNFVEPLYYYKLIETVSLSISDFYMRLKGKDIYILHQFTSSLDRENLLSAAKNGMIHIPFSVSEDEDYMYADIKIKVKMKNQVAPYYPQNSRDVKLIGNILHEHISHQDIYPLILRYASNNVRDPIRMFQFQHYKHGFPNYYSYEMVLDNVSKKSFELCDNGNITQVLYLVEKPNSPFQFYSMKEHPLQDLKLSVHSFLLEPHCDVQDFLITDKIFNGYPVVEDIAIYSKTFQSSFRNYLENFKYFKHVENGKLKKFKTDSIERSYITECININNEVTLNPQIPSGTNLYVLIRSEVRLKNTV